MLKVKVYNIKGETVGEVDLNDKIFGVKADTKFIQSVITRQRANAFVPFAHTKTRGEVRGGGRKPWRQKGTGNARQGSIRSPQWRKGGVVFGPRKERRVNKKINLQEKKLALKMVLADKVKNDKFIVLESFQGLNGKTKELNALLKKLPVKVAKVLIAPAKKNELLTRAARNLPAANTTLVDSLNISDTLCYNFLLTDKTGIQKIVKHFFS